MSERINFRFADVELQKLDAEAMREARGVREAAMSLSQMVNRAVTDFLLDELPKLPRRAQLPKRERGAAEMRKFPVRMNAENLLALRAAAERFGVSENAMANHAVSALALRLTSHADVSQVKTKGKRGENDPPTMPVVLVDGWGDEKYPLGEGAMLPATVYPDPDGEAKGRRTYRSERHPDWNPEPVQALVVRRKPQAGA